MLTIFYGSSSFVQIEIYIYSTLILFFRQVYSEKTSAYINLAVQLIKGTHTVYFSSSLYIINQKPMIPRTHFRCITTWVARSSG